MIYTLPWCNPCCPRHADKLSASISFVNKTEPSPFSSLECLTGDIDLCLTYYKYPYRHWRKIRTTNAVERSFREVRQRVRGIGRFKDEERALTMVYYQIKELRWHGVDMTAEARAILAKIKSEKLGRIAA